MSNDQDGREEDHGTRCGLCDHRSLINPCDDCRRAEDTGRGLWRHIDLRDFRHRDRDELDAELEGTPNFNQSPSGVSVSDFIHLWDSINAKRGYGWDVNPWVWVVEFKRVAP